MATMFEVGSLVNVDSRTWPGINKQGGVGRVIAVDSEHSTVDVKYVLGQTETKIDFSFVQLHVFLDDDPPAESDGKSRRLSRRAQKVEAKARLDEEKKKREKEQKQRELKNKPLTLKEKCASIVHPITPGPARSKKKKSKGERNSDYDLDQMISTIQSKKLIGKGDNENYPKKKVPVVTPGHSAKKKKNSKQITLKDSDKKIILSSSKASIAPKKKQHIHNNSNKINCSNVVTGLEKAEINPVERVQSDKNSASIQTTMSSLQSTDSKSILGTTVHPSKPEMSKVNDTKQITSSISPVLGTDAKSNLGTTMHPSKPEMSTVNDIKQITPSIQSVPATKSNLGITVHPSKSETTTVNDIHQITSSTHKTKKQKVNDLLKHNSIFLKSTQPKIHSILGKRKEEAHKNLPKSDAPIIHNGLEMMYRDNSKKAAEFVNDVVAVSQSQNSKEMDIENECKEVDNATKQDEIQSEGEDALTVAAKEE